MDERGKCTSKLILQAHFLCSLADAFTFLMDAPLMAVGYTTMLLYVMANLGSRGLICTDRNHLVESRCLLALAGIVAVALGVTASMGLLMIMGYSFSQLLGTVAFLALGEIIGY